MDNSCFRGKTLDDVMRQLIGELLKNGTQVTASRGDTLEFQGILLEIENPRARYSRTETKGKPFSGLGELCWYLAKNNNLDFIQYYLSGYKDEADGSVIKGGYGPRLFKWKRGNQVSLIIETLRQRPTSRQAVIQIFDANDLIKKNKSVPCTSTLQFLVRGGKLNMITSMRSNDAYIGLPHDVFCFTMLQEIIARSLSIEIGSYQHFVGSMHIYEKDVEKAKKFLEEGWQTTKMAMPPMPYGDPWSSIDKLLRAEKKIRLQGNISKKEISQVHPYWADIIRLLQVFRYSKEKDIDGIQNCRNLMSTEIYHSFIDKMIYSIKT
ncbi:MAG TPA: thymidylate synthase [Cytophagales bacterium]|nr:thymidylate synthase [Cytophagales bacterium]HRJ54972.1 thymidylate synthase [Anaerolineales bacterium]